MPEQTWPALYADTTLANGALRIHPTPPAAWPAQRLLLPASGCLPPAPPAPSSLSLVRRRSSRRSRWGRRDCAERAATASTPLRSSGNRGAARPNRSSAALDCLLLPTNAATARQPTSPRPHRHARHANPPTPSRHGGGAQGVVSWVRPPHGAAGAPPAGGGVCIPRHRRYRPSPTPL